MVSLLTGNDVYGRTLMLWYFYDYCFLSKVRFLSFNFSAFVQEELQANLDLIQTYRLHIAQDINQDNLQLFLTSYNRYRITFCLTDSSRSFPAQ